MNDKSVQKPLDPSGNAQDFMNDTSGRTGMTTSDKTNEQERFSQEDLKNTLVSKDGANPTNSGSVARSMSDAAYNRAMDIAAGAEDVAEKDKLKKMSSEPQNIDEVHQPNDVPNVEGEQAESGSAPHPNSDDDTLKNEHDVGLQATEDSEHPQELDIASGIDKAEESLQTH